MSEPSRDGRRRICLVTAEFHGLFKNGGIGTANTGLALTLADAGHDVTVAYVDAGLVEYDERVAAAADTIAAWAKRGIKLEFVPRHPMLRAGHEDHVAASFAVLRYLEGRGFETVFFNECGGQGYYSLLAKKAGLFPQPPRMIVVTHGANAWVLELNAQLYWSLHPVSVDFLERRSVELADDLVSPSRYLVGWMSGRGWRLPASTRVIQNALPVAPAPTRPARAPVGEVVFFGRLEARKGVDLFLSAYSQLCAARDMRKTKVTFLGKFSRIEGVHSGVYVLERTRAWPAPPTLITELGQEQALAYLSRPGVLAVMPSRAENSPCVAAECLIAGVPFIATDSGGTAELIAEADRARTLCANTPEALAAGIAAALDGAEGAKMAVPQAQSRREWLDLVAEPPAAAVSPAARTATSLCLAAPPASAEAWAAILAQEFAEIVLVSADAAGPSDPRVRRIVAPGLDVAAARNRAAVEAQGPWLMFLDEGDVVLKPQALAGFLAAAAGLGAEIVTSPALGFSHGGAPREGWDGFIGLLPAGANLPLAAFDNCLGEGCFLSDRARFLAVGGFKSDASPALRDRLLLTEAALSGATLEVAATPLFWRRERPAAPLAFPDASADQRRLLAAYAGSAAGLLAAPLESVAAGGPRTRDRVTAALGGLGAAARELALKLSFMPQRDSVEQNRPFLDYCLARGRLAEAFAFAQWLDDPDLAALARAGAEAAAEKAALGALREPAAKRTRSVSLTRIAADRAQGLGQLAGVELARGDGESIRHPLNGGVAIVKAAGLCPPQAARIAVLAEAPSGARVALVACDRFALLRLDGDALTSDERFAWTGWRDPGEIALDLAEPFDAPADLLLLSKGARGGVAWTRLSADVALFEFKTPSLVELEAGVTPLPRRVLASAELLTPASDFQGPYFVPGPPTTHHPLVGRPALVRLKHAVFQGATGLRASFSLEHAQSRPVEFGLWARRPGAVARDVAALADAAHFSGWQAVRSAFREHRAEIAFPEPLRQPHDLYLATRVVDFPDNSYCHAVWHDIFVIETTKRAA